MIECHFVSARIYTTQPNFSSHSSCEILEIRKALSSENAFPGLEKSGGKCNYCGVTITTWISKSEIENRGRPAGSAIQGV